LLAQDTGLGLAHSRNTSAGSRLGGHFKTGVVDRVSIGSAGSIVAIDVESGEILAAKNLEFAGKQVKGGDSTPRWLRNPF